VWHCTVERNGAEGLSFAEPQSAVAGLAKARRISKHGLEHWLQLPRRTADHAEHFRGCCLLLQRLAQLSRTISQLVQEPGVLDRDDRLLCEVRDERYLLVGKGTDFLAVDRECADQFVLFEHRYGAQCPDAAEFNRGNR